MFVGVADELFVISTDWFKPFVTPVYHTDTVELAMAKLTKMIQIFTRSAFIYRPHKAIVFGIHKRRHLRMRVIKVEF